MEVGVGVITYVVEQKPYLAKTKILYHKGLTFLILKQPDKALMCFEKVLDLDPKDPKIWYFLVVHHPDYMRQYGEIIDTPYETGIRNTQLCLSVK